MKEVFEDEDGQAMVEYAMLLVLVMLLVISTYVPVLAAMMRFYKLVAFFVALPVP